MKSPLTQGTREACLAIAQQAIAQRVAGDPSWLPEGAFERFMLDEGGMCARFVRMCIEFALGQRPQTWKGKAANANTMQDVMAALDWQIDPADAKPGHVVCLNFDANGDRFDRPGRTTVVLGRKAVGNPFVATHTHMSLFRGTPERSYGNFAKSEVV